MVRFDDVEWARFLTLYEQLGVYAKAVFVKSRVFGDQPYIIVKHEDIDRHHLQ